MARGALGGSRLAPRAGGALVGEAGGQETPEAQPVTVDTNGIRRRAVQLTDDDSGVNSFFLSNDGTKHTVCYNIVTGTVIVAPNDLVAQQFRAFSRIAEISTFAEISTQRSDGTLKRSATLRYEKH